MSLFRKSKDINEELIQFQNTKNAILLDVRSKEEYEMSHIPESINIGLTDIEKVNEIIKDKSTMIFVYCFSGARSEKACRKIKEMGYKNIKNIGGISQYQGKVI